MNEGQWLMKLVNQAFLFKAFCDREYKFEVISESVLINLTVIKSKPLGS